MSRAFRRMGVVTGLLAMGCALGPQDARWEIVFDPLPPLEFDALGDTLTVQAFLLDQPLLGAGGQGTVTVRDTSVVALLPGGRLVSRASGSTWVVVTAADLVDSVELHVTPVTAAFDIQVPAGPAGVVMVSRGETLGLTCRPLDRNGYPIPSAVSVEAIARGTVQGTGCDDLVAVASGADTLVLRSDSLTTSVPLWIALPPELPDGPGGPLVVDSFPAGVEPWAPSMARAPDGTVELYFAGYNGVADLHRMRSADGGRTWTYAGIALPHDPDFCAPDGWAIENVAIAPRSDAAGWRMFYVGGSGCTGWQVYSAVSTDRDVWEKEPGVRVPNGMDGSGTNWPVGEGMRVEPAPGGWRMVAGGYQNVTPSIGRFEIVDWFSPDQLQWSYRGLLLGTEDLPPEGSRTVYSPALRAFAPGLQRMLVTADNLQAGGQSRIMSAVSPDGEHWQFEAIVLERPGTDLYYCALVDDRLVYIQKPPGGTAVLETTRVVMP